MKQKLNTDLQRRLYNPNLLPRKIVCKTGDTPEHTEFYEKYLAAIKQTSYRYLAYGLESSYVEEDQGFGGFYDSGFISTSFIGGRYSTINDSNWEKDFKFYWPKDLRTGKYMRYLGSINLGNWPRVFSDYTQIKPESYYCNVSLAGGSDLWRNRGDLREHINIWINVFVGEECGDFETMVPDCHIRMNFVNDFAKMSEWHQQYYTDRKTEQNAWSDDQLKAKMKEWQETMCVKSQVKGAPKFFSKPKMRFHYDGPNYERDRQKGIFEYTNRDIDIYGIPHSQQEPRRYLSPEGHFHRALSPIFSFSDDGTDMTHQFYCDTLTMDEICHTRSYCKLDSSCT